MNSRTIGSRGEDIATDYLLEQGFQVLDRNIYSPYGEVDVFAIDPVDNTLIVVEVKFFDITTDSLEYVIGKDKQARMILTLQDFLASRIIDYRYIRFDVIHIDRTTLELTHIEHAFDGGSLL